MFVFNNNSATHPRPQNQDASGLCTLHMDSYAQAVSQ